MGTDDQDIITWIFAENNQKSQNPVMQAVSLFSCANYNGKKITRKQLKMHGIANSAEFDSFWIFSQFFSF